MISSLPFQDILSHPFPWALPPAFIMFAGALVALMLRGWLQHLVALIVPLIGVWNLLSLNMTDHWSLTVMGLEMELLRLDRLSFLFGLLFHLAAFLGVLYAAHVKDRIQQAAALAYAGSAVGAVFAADLISLFVYWELLAVTSVFLIWARGTDKAMQAGMRYMIIQVASGMLLLAGALVHVHETGSTAFTYMGLGTLASWLIFIAIGVKCAFPLFHSWLVDAYGEATPSGTVLLSAFTTKVSVYCFARAFPGTELLIYVGGAMTCFPIFYAVIENDLRRVLAYSMINQIGFMVVGVGIGTTLAMNGAVSHAFNDVIFKGLLFMSMGAVLHVTGRINGSDLGGLYKSMPITTTLCIVGAASISAFPLFSGFVSKSMVMAAAMEEGHIVIWLGLLFASAGVFHHAGIKIPYFAFFAHDSGLRVKEPPWNMLLAMTIGASICLFNGSYPWILYSMLPWTVDYQPFTDSHVLAQLQILFFSALAFTWLMLSGLYPPELRSINLDAEWFYRRLAPRILNGIGGMISGVDTAVRQRFMAALNGAIGYVWQHHGPEGSMARTWTTGNMVLLVTIFLCVYLVFSLL
jgi:multicomponent Na+:H+ antiporter subunit D